jgi:hypothetical protein
VQAVEFPEWELADLEVCLGAVCVGPRWSRHYHQCAREIPRRCACSGKFRVSTVAWPCCMDRSFGGEEVDVVGGRARP